ncbi:hypothetical protein H0H87_008190 [Tephrocybe sp. NHM501043]|nr:hypothetical protein H0H87_008190 [Tephrocybe sp. NHM501043]
MSSVGSTASTLVAEDGSVASGGRRFRFKRRSRRSETATTVTQQPAPIRSNPAQHQVPSSPVRQMATIQSVPDLLDLRSVISEVNSDINIPVISPSLSPTVSVSNDSHLVHQGTSSDGHAFWDEFILHGPNGCTVAADGDSNVPSPARVSSLMFEFECIGAQPEETSTYRTTEGTSDIWLPQVPPPIASTGRERAAGSLESIETSQLQS